MPPFAICISPTKVNTSILLQSEACVGSNLLASGLPGYTSMCVVNRAFIRLGAAESIVGFIGIGRRCRGIGIRRLCAHKRWRFMIKPS